MGQAMLDYSSLERKILLISLLIHLIAAQIFIISFPVKTVAFKPILIFWGSFFNAADGAGEGCHLLSEQESLRALTPQGTNESEAYTEQTRVQKPAALDSCGASKIISDEKRVMKSTFLDKISSDPEMPKEEMERLNQTKVRYEPLRVKTGLIP